MSAFGPFQPLSWNKLMSGAQSKAEIVRSTHCLHSVELLLVVNLGAFQDHFLHMEHMAKGLFCPQSISSYV
jgi:hypothetical protein